MPRRFVNSIYRLKSDHIIALQDVTHIFNRVVVIMEVPRQPVRLLLSPKLGIVFKFPEQRKPMEYRFSTTFAEAGSSPRDQLPLLSSIKLFAVSYFLTAFSFLQYTSKCAVRAFS